MSSPAVVTAPSGLWVHRGSAPRMAGAHRHDDLELNLVTSGRLDYVFGGRPLSIPAGRLALFWAATPHGLVEADDVEPAQVSWLHLPLETALGWRLPDDGIARLLRDRPIVVDAAPLGELESTFARWGADVAAADTARIALLEAQALVRRVLLAEAEEHVYPGGGVPDPVAAMAAFLATRFREPVRVADVAAIAHLHPSTAMESFRRGLGVTVGAYLTRCRIAEGQRLLITTDDAVGTIAPAAGFGSQSAFYEAFRQATGVAPAEYRRRMRGSRGSAG